MRLTSLANDSGQLLLILNYLNNAASLDERLGVYYCSFPDSPYSLAITLNGTFPEAHWCLSADPYNSLYSGQVAVTSYNQLVALCRTIREGKLPELVYPHGNQLAS